jgi:hypothetical protein
MSTFKFNTNYRITTASNAPLHGLQISHKDQLGAMGSVVHEPRATIQTWDEMSILLRSLPDLIELANLVGAVTKDAAGGRLGRLREQWQKATTQAQDIAGYYKHCRTEDELRRVAAAEEQQRRAQAQRRANPQWETPTDLPEGLAPVPDGWVYAGFGPLHLPDSLVGPEGSHDIGGHYGSTSLRTDEWDTESGWGGTIEGDRYIVRIGSPVYAHLVSVAWLTPEEPAAPDDGTGHFRGCLILLPAMPPNLPALPEGWTYLGIGPLANHEQAGFTDDIAAGRPDWDGWWDFTGWGGRWSHLHYAVRNGTPTADILLPAGHPARN